MSKSELISQLESAIDNEWMLRPVKGNKFHNIDYAKDLKIDEPSQILNELEDLNKFPEGTTGFALIPKLHDGFISVDLDFTDEDLKKEVWKLLSIYKKEDLFLRIGNREKIGQIWFKTYDEISFCSYTGVDIITTQKRCDAIGYYKGDKELTYLWPYKKFYDHCFDDLPIINKDLVEKIVRKINEFYGEETKKNLKNSGSRHDQIVEMATSGINSNLKVRDVIGEIMESDAFKSMAKERNAVAEASNAMSWAIKNAVQNYVNIKIENKEDESLGYNIPLMPPSVEKNSFFDMIYKAIRRNQRIDNKRMAMVSSLSICSWILSLSVRFEDLCPNLMILLIAPSGSGKSTSTKAIKEIIKIEKKLKQSYFGQDIRTDSAIFSSIQESPVGFYNIDEASKLFKSIGAKGSHVQNLPEILSQLYSDYKDSDPPQAMAKLKNESYGVAIGAKINMIAYSTETFWNDFEESNYTQGLGRRLFIVTSSTTPKERTDFEFSPEFFKKDEQQLIKMFMTTYIGDEDLYEEVDIRGYNIIESVTSKEGIKTTRHFHNCKKPKIKFRLKADKKAAEYLNGDFIKESNNFRVQASASGSQIQEYVANSRAEFIKKFAMIHTVCGKRMSPKSFEAGEKMSINVRTSIGLDSIEWGTQMFDYYMIGSTLENIDSIFGKEKVIDRNKQTIEDLLDKLKEKKIEEFKKSNYVLKDFFKRLGGSKYRNIILKEMNSKGLIKIDGDLDYYKCSMRVL